MIQITPFNMKEELEEGHFDGDGHFQWNKEAEIKDHWLDNLDWVKIKKLDDHKKQWLAENGTEPSGSKSGGGLAESSDSEDDENDESLKKFDVIAAYRRILKLMQPKETIQRTLQRLGKKSAKISSIERFRRKKAGIIDEDAALVTEITELTNKILTKMGNMDIYDETYEEIDKKFGSKLKTVAADDALDMYADDFDTKEQNRMGTSENGESSSTTNPSNANSATTSTCTSKHPINDEVKWEYKWKPDDTESHGPFTSEQMQKWVDDGHFKDGVFVRKAGTEASFNSSNRIDFELYM